MGVLLKTSNFAVQVWPHELALAPQTAHVSLNPSTGVGGCFLDLVNEQELREQTYCENPTGGFADVLLISCLLSK